MTVTIFFLVSIGLGVWLGTDVQRRLPAFSSFCFITYENNNTKINYNLTIIHKNLIIANICWTFTKCKTQANNSHKNPMMIIFLFSL